MKFALLPVWVPLALGVFVGGCQTPTPVATPDAPTSSANSVAPRAARAGAEPGKPVASETARTLAQNCYTCHGPNAKSPGAIPSLAPLSAQRIVARLRNFKSGAEPSTVMGRHARAYTDAELEAIASYIAGVNKAGDR